MADNPDTHLYRAQAYLDYARKPEVIGNALVSALYTLQALTEATIAQAQLLQEARAERPYRT